MNRTVTVQGAIAYAKDDGFVDSRLVNVHKASDEVFNRQKEFGDYQNAVLTLYEEGALSLADVFMLASNAIAHTKPYSILSPKEKAQIDSL